MQIGNSNSSSMFSFLNIKPDSAENIEKIKESASKIDAKNITQNYFLQFQNNTFSNTSGNINVQVGLMSFSLPEPFMPGNSNNSGGLSSGLSDLISKNISQTGYTGKPISSLSQDEAKALISENGYFGVANTADRIAGFVISGAGDNLEKLQSGLEGVKKGFAEAEKLWGSKLPDISQETMSKTVSQINQRISELGGNTLNVTA
ncbi:hypothetical protein [Campylobacter fetus]|uniref:hypothetical protein n=2 Tax=Campylobacter fetus TaxID=196 RepID=UPI000818813D|nr:hypothetical protein [Campylobacter fetus]EAK0826767.1 hypothetical protein [Campylobacter fetus]EAK0830411.1 hypothetical protein [Campylobacter fetus]OCR85481.1 hypothetical protein CFT12S05168_04795 [Campylobacter fetus subsp. testudinum]